MPDGNASALDVEDDIDFTIHVAWECYCDLELVQDAVARQPDFKGAIALAVPCVPDPESLIEDADLVLVVADKANLAPAMARVADYKLIKQATLLIYLQGDEHPLSEHVPGLTIPRAQLPVGVTRVIKTLIEPVFPQGLICVDWCDTRHILDLDGRALLEEASGCQPEEVMASALGRLRKHASGRSIRGMQVSILCSQNRLKMRHIHELVSACKEMLGEYATLIAAVPLLDWPDSDRFEIRIFAKLGSPQEQEP